MFMAMTRKRYVEPVDGTVKTVNKSAFSAIYQAHPGIMRYVLVLWSVGSMDLQGPLKHSHSYSNRNPNLPLSKILYSFSSNSHRYIVIKDSLTAPLNRIGLIQR